MFKYTWIPCMLFVLVLAITSASASANGGNGQNGNQNGNKNDKQLICHATGSSSNPFVSIEPNKNGDVDGHAGQSHQDGRDIIPPFTYNDHGTTKTFPGQNWDDNGMTIWANGCNKPSSTPPPPTTTPPSACKIGVKDEVNSTPTMLVCTVTVYVNVPVPGPVQVVTNTVTVNGNPQCTTGKEVARGPGTVTCEVPGPERILERVVEKTQFIYGNPKCIKPFKPVAKGKGWVRCSRTIVNYKTKTKTIVKVRVVHTPKSAYTR